MPQSILSQLPGVDKLLTGAGDLVTTYGHPRVAESIRQILDEIREELKAGRTDVPTDLEIIESLSNMLREIHAPSLTRVINLTGTVLHTNLGRAELPLTAIEAISQVATSYSNLEFEMNTGRRGDRDSHIESLLLDITGAEAMTVVNNNAAAVMLALNTLADQKEVPVSRGELVEIGGSFRIPEVMQRSGCHLIEVGATNRTHARDYEKAVNENTALLMKVHTSNYEIQGFTESVSDEEVAKIAASHDLPFVTDLGSGTLVDLTRWGLPYEPTVQSTLAAGADLVPFSGDKLLGGPQCGIIVGKSELISKIKNNPMKRALRVDKMTIAALFEVLKLYLDPDSLPRTLPTLRYLTRSFTEIEALAKKLLPELQDSLKSIAQVSLESCESQIGSGSLPASLLPSCALRITPKNPSDSALTELASQFRGLPVPIIGRMQNGSLYFDLRTLSVTEPVSSQLHLIST